MSFNDAKQSRWKRAEYRAAKTFGGQRNKLRSQDYSLRVSDIVGVLGYSIEVKYRLNPAAILDDLLTEAAEYDGKKIPIGIIYGEKDNGGIAIMWATDLAKLTSMGPITGLDRVEDPIKEIPKKIYSLSIKNKPNVPKAFKDVLKQAWGYDNQAVPIGVFYCPQRRDGLAIISVRDLAVLIKRAKNVETNSNTGACKRTPRKPVESKGNDIGSEAAQG